MLKLLLLFVLTLSVSAARNEALTYGQTVPNTPLKFCSVCGGLSLACLDKIHIRHAFRGFVILLKLYTLRLG